MSRILLVGLGDVSRAHQVALGGLRTARVIGGVDPDPARSSLCVSGLRIPVVPTLEEHSGEPPDVVLVAVPTPHHVETARTVLEVFPTARLLVEKPLGHSRSGTRQLRAEAAACGTRLTTLLHAAHGPEVLWAAQNLERWRMGSGGVVAVTCTFIDPHDRSDFREARRASLVDPWTDSAINAYSVLGRLGLLPSESPAPVSWQGTVTAIGGVQSDRIAIRVMTSWAGTAPSKHTQLRFEDGSAVVLDHQSMMAWRSGDGHDETFAGTSRVPRLVQHYQSVFGELEQRDWSWQEPFDERAHELALLG